MVVFDNCPFGESYRHRQVLITNHPVFALLSKNCDGMREHAVVTSQVPAWNVSQYSKGFCDAYASLVRGAVDATASRNARVHCLGAQLHKLHDGVQPSNPLTMGSEFMDESMLDEMRLNPVGVGRPMGIQHW